MILIVKQYKYIFYATIYFIVQRILYNYRFLYIIENKTTKTRN